MLRRLNVCFLVPVSLMIVVLLTSRCGRTLRDASDIEVTDVAHTPVKRQSIGNCWIYATATWAESLHLSATGEELNLSESYWTYWDWYSKLMTSQYGDSINTGGSWYDASQIIRAYGWMGESDFIPAEATAEMSQIQLRAENTVNRELKTGGKLATTRQRTSNQVLAVLNEAFGVDMKKLTPLRHKASDFVVAKVGTDRTLGLDSVIAGGARFQTMWSDVRYPMVWGKGSVASASTSQARKELIKRVMHALNDRKPVIMSVDVDFNALKTDPYATFDLATIQRAGMGRQGGHLVVLEDYTVDHVPGLGALGEGEMAPDVKQKALFGDLVYLKAKNSWGANRPERGLKDGYTAFREDYLDAVLPWSTVENGTDPNRATWHNALSGFVLPPGY